MELLARKVHSKVVNNNLVGNLTDDTFSDHNGLTYQTETLYFHLFHTCQLPQKVHKSSF